MLYCHDSLSIRDELDLRRAHSRLQHHRNPTVQFPYGRSDARSVGSQGSQVIAYRVTLQPHGCHTHPKR